MTDITLPSDEERQMLRDSLRGFLESHWPSGDAVSHAESPDAVQRVYRELAEQGFTALGTDPSEGGVREILIVQQELGRAACPAPLLAASLINLLLQPQRGQPQVDVLLAALHRGDAYAAVAFGPLDQDRTAGQLVLDDTRLSGEARYLDAAAGVTHTLAVLSSSRVAIVPTAASKVSLVPTRALGAQGLATLHFDQAPATVLEVTEQALQDLVRVARLAAAARAYGAAARAFELVVQYAKERKQFGRFIGSFQAIQHKLVNNHITLEGVQLSLDQAGAQHDQGLASWRVQAASVCAYANASLRQVSLETHHAFGAIGYAEEHEAPRHFKQVHQDVLRLGGGRRAREELAAYYLDAANGLPEFDLGAAGNAFREEVRAWLKQHWTPEDQARMHSRPNAHREYDADFAKALGATGWLGISWPKRFGGQDRSPLEYLAYVEELERAEAPRAGAPIQAVAWMLFGNEAQQQRYLPEILRGAAIYGMWYSEPDSGSDLASMRTRAVKDGDEFIINGQKIWTTSYWGDYMWLAARTDPDASPPHAGISLFCVSTKTPGITIRPVKTMYDGEFVNTFFDDVRVPADALVGKLNGGWEVLTGSLGTERSVVGARILVQLSHSFELVCEYIRHVSSNGRPLSQDPLVRDTIGGFAAQIEIGRQLALHGVTLAGQGETPQAHAAITKIFAGELMERFFEAAQDILGMEAALSLGSEGAILRGRLEQKLRHSLMWVISIGTNEIQRGLVAQRGLGLPRK
ncbi:MAG: acyl-CoA dehydrogenase family protein [Janthinobacterium lividum]